MKIKILSRKDVQCSVTMLQAIDVVKQAFISLAEKDVLLPLRTQVPVEGSQGITLFMPAYIPKLQSLGAKIVSVFPQNTQNNLPTIHAIVILCDAKTGQPTAVMDGTHLTALRTGAAAGVATDFLARKGARKAAIIGAGIQGRTQLEAICCVRDIRKVLVYDIEHQTSEVFAEEMKNRGKPFPQDISAAATSEEAVREADVISVATTSSIPVFDDAHLKPGVHINGIGSYTPEMQEIPEETVARARVVVDSISASLEEAGDIIRPLGKGLISQSHIQGELGQVASGQLKVRRSEQDVTLFKSVGLAIQDVAVAKWVFQRAQDLCLGTDLDV